MNGRFNNPNPGISIYLSLAYIRRPLLMQILAVNHTKMLQLLPRYSHLEARAACAEGSGSAGSVLGIIMRGLNYSVLGKSWNMNSSQSHLLGTKILLNWVFTSL